MFRLYCTRLLIDDRWSAHGRFARAYKRVAHASMETIVGEEGGILTHHDESVSRRTPDAHGREQGILCGEGNGDAGAKYRMVKRLDGGWWERVGRPADVAILRECLNRDHVVNPSHTSSRPSSIDAILLHPSHDRMLFPDESYVHPFGVRVHLFMSLPPFWCFTLRWGQFIVDRRHDLCVGSTKEHYANLRERRMLTQ